MPSDRTLQVMISSRCRDEIEWQGDSQPVSALRKEIKRRVTGYAPFGEQLFECWINEDSPGTEGSTTAWTSCLNQVRRADILIVLYNGNPGWSGPDGTVGICHAELDRGLSTGGAKVYAIELPEVELPKDAGERARHERFRGFYRSQDLFVSIAADGDGALQHVPPMLHEAVVELSKLGGRETRKGKYDTGEALDWSRQSFFQRKEEIEAVLRSALAGRDEPGEVDGNVTVRIRGVETLVAVHGVPDAMSNATAREMVGRPFHRDHRLAPRLSGRVAGPVHVIGVHKGVTEKQARDLLGQPDVSTVVTAFGVLAVDRISKVQCFLLRNCRDDTSTRHAVQRALAWISRSGEDDLVAKRAQSRARIVKAIANEAALG
jgi:hypothetical protein